MGSALLVPVTEEEEKTSSTYGLSPACKLEELRKRPWLLPGAPAHQFICLGLSVLRYAWGPLLNRAWL